MGPMDKDKGPVCALCGGPHRTQQCALALAEGDMAGARLPLWVGCK